MKRRCLGCKRIITGPVQRCGPCKVEHDRFTQRMRDRAPARRAMKSKRYGPAHRKQRLTWDVVVNLGGVDCARCGAPIAPFSEWHLDHLPNGKSAPSHKACNLAHTSRTSKGNTGHRFAPLAAGNKP